VKIDNHIPNARAMRSWGALLACLGLLLTSVVGSSSVIGQQQIPPAAPQRTSVEVIDPPPPPPGEGIELTVRALDASTGQPLAGVAIELSRPPSSADRRSWTHKSLTDGGGQVRFDDLSADRYNVAAKLEGRTLVAGSVQNVTLARGAKANSIILRMHRASIIEGAVQDDSGKPVLGAVVELLEEQWTAGQRTLARVKTSRPTANDGRFVLDSVLPGPYYLRARFAANTIKEQLEQSDQLPKPEDRHVAYVSTLFPSAMFLELAETVTIFEGVNRPEVIITAQKSRYFRVRGTVNNLSPEVPTPGLIFIRTVSFDSRFPFLADEPYDEALPTQIRPDGTFTFERGLPPGQYWAGYTPGGVGDRFGGVDFRVDDRDVELNTDLWRSIPFEGRVVYDDGSPAQVRGALRTFWARRSIRSDSLSTRADGTFSRPLYADGVFRLDLEGNVAIQKIEKDGRVFEGPEFEVTPAGGPAVITVTRGGAAISGTVDLHTTTTTYPRGMVTLSLDPLNPLDNPRRQRLNGTNTFKFDHLSAGRYRVCAWAEEGTEINRVLNNPLYDGRLATRCQSVEVRFDEAKTTRVKQISTLEFGQ
jgi:protocatechuate 3,4-dioxygenase beta subunit